MTHYLQKHARFNSIAEMDEAVAKHCAFHRYELNKTDQLVLDVIRRYSVKYGAAHLKHATIETAIGKSNATVRRAIRKLEQLGIIQRIHYVRPVMSGLGANIYIILPFDDQGSLNSREDADNPHDDEGNEPISEKEPLFLKSSLKDLTNTSPMESKKLSTSLFSRMKELLSNTIGETKKARDFYGIHRSLSSEMLRFDIYKDDGEIFNDLAYRALKITVMATKRKQIRNLPGYYKGVLRKLIDETYFKDMFMYFDVPVENFYIPENYELI
ncbi:helix-turn-helix domain-containing protein [Psychrobacillus sp. FSL K6-2836]|uniref:helix-turn-helix domain-containing protein n=1 Tax=Psychrobacillus sp. FSL K6-2836 TaxID=2921548 RepID=UPI0030F61C28